MAKCNCPRVCYDVAKEGMSTWNCRGEGYDRRVDIRQGGGYGIAYEGGGPLVAKNQRMGGLRDYCCSICPNGVHVP